MNAKTITAALILSIGTLAAQTKSTTTTKSSQTSDPCETLKKENESLKKSLNISEPITTETFGDIEFKIIKVKGDKKTQMVTIDVLMTNNIQNREVKLNKNFLKLVTVDGDVFQLGGFIVAGTSYATNAYLNTGVPIKSSFSFGTMLPSNEYIKLFNFAFTILHPQDFYQSKDWAIEFKDLKIDWK
jgi:hypothetical protein